jgi:hypothetical protein
MTFGLWLVQVSDSLGLHISNFKCRTQNPARSFNYALLQLIISSSVSLKRAEILPEKGYRYHLSGFASLDSNRDTL